MIVVMYIKCVVVYYSDMLSLGSSKPWPDAMFELTGQRNWDAQAMMDYFKPLTDWLKAENDKHDTPRGWEEACPPVSYDLPKMRKSTVAGSVSILIGSWNMLLLMLLSSFILL